MNSVTNEIDRCLFLHVEKASSGSGRFYFFEPLNTQKVKLEGSRNTLKYKITSSLDIVVRFPC